MRSGRGGPYFLKVGLWDRFRRSCFLEVGSRLRLREVGSDPIGAIRAYTPGRVLRRSPRRPIPAARSPSPGLTHPAGPGFLAARDVVGALISNPISRSWPWADGSSQRSSGAVAVDVVQSSQQVSRHTVLCFLSPTGKPALRLAAERADGQPWCDPDVGSRRRPASPSRSRIEDSVERRHDPGRRVGPTRHSAGSRSSSATAPAAGPSRRPGRSRFAAGVSVARAAFRRSRRAVGFPWP